LFHTKLQHVLDITEMAAAGEHVQLCSGSSRLVKAAEAASRNSPFHA
jgi:hypothetical protein